MIDINALDVIKNMPGYLLWRGRDMKYIGCNLLCAQLLGFDSKKDIEGIENLNGYSPQQIKHSNPKINVNDVDRTTEKEDETSILGKSQLILDAHLYGKDQEFKVLLTRKVPLLDSSGKIAGCLVHLNEIPQPTLANIHTLINIPNIKISDESFDELKYQFQEDQTISLSSRQKQCLKYLTQGRSAKMIAKKMNISSRTVETHIETIKAKMNCANKQELIDKVWDEHPYLTTVF